MVGGYGDGEVATLFFDLSLREWKTLPDLPAGGSVSVSNPGGRSGQHPLVMGGDLGDQVHLFDVRMTMTMENKHNYKDTRSSLQKLLSSRYQKTKSNGQ